MKRLRDLRGYIDALKSYDEVQEINIPVDWNLEIGAITRRTYELRAPAPLFNNIKGCASGFRVLGAPIGVSGNAGRPYTRIALSLGLPAASTASEIIEYMSGWARLDKRRAPKVVTQAPSQENVIMGEDIDMMSFPSPLIHDGDGGRYFGTLAVLVTRSPDKSWTNWSVHRCMLHEKKNKLFVNFSTSNKIGKHAAMIYAMWQEIGKPMPVAVVQGVAPLILMIASTPLPDRVSEGEVLGAFLDEDIEVVRCKTVDLEVPAFAEIIVEGLIGPDDHALEGPMGEYCGYLTPNSAREKPLMNVTAITYRDQPILPVCAAGYPAEENHTCWGTAIAASVLAELRAQDFPVTTCFIPFETAIQWLVVTVDSKRQPSEDDPDSTEFARRIGEAVFQTRGGINIPKVIVVHDDIDPANLVEVSWAFATRCHAGIGEIHLEHLRHNPLEICLHTDEIAPPNSTKTVYNCLFQGRSPGDKLRRSSFEHIYPQDVQKKVLDNWSRYGFS